MEKKLYLPTAHTSYSPFKNIQLQGPRSNHCDMIYSYWSITQSLYRTLGRCCRTCNIESKVKLFTDLAPSPIQCTIRNLRGYVVREGFQKYILNISRSQKAAQRTSNWLLRCQVALTKILFQVVSEIEFSQNQSFEFFHNLGF